MKTLFIVFLSLSLTACETIPDRQPTDMEVISQGINQAISTITIFGGK